MLPVSDSTANANANASVNVNVGLTEVLRRHGQIEVFRFRDELTPEQRAQLDDQVGSIDFDQLDFLIAEFAGQGEAAEPPYSTEKVKAIEVFRLPQTDGERVMRRVAAELGEEMLGRGEIAVVVVAGGSGTRLGFEGPKGTYPIGAVSNSSLFQIHAEKVVALGRRHGRPIPLYVMTSHDNHDATVEFFAKHDQFGLDHVRFFKQGRMPAVDKNSGKILLSAKDEVALSPDGHGSTLTALAARGPEDAPSCLDEMRGRGVRTIFYFQVDNPLVKIADPSFLGLHRQGEAEMTFKVIEKIAPDEKVGVVVQVDGVPQVIEYSDLPAHLAERREPEGGLELWAGSIAIHLLELEFIDRIVSGETPLPFHRANKKVPFVDEAGTLISPTVPNALKFERFIFDALPMAKRWALVETDRSVEFEPLKNASGSDSPQSVRRRMTEQFATWLETAGASVMREDDGSIPFAIEISPLYALNAAELKAKGVSGLVVDRAIYFR